MRCTASYSIPIIVQKVPGMGSGLFAPAVAQPSRPVKIYSLIKRIISSVLFYASESGQRVVERGHGRSLSRSPHPVPVARDGRRESATPRKRDLERTVRTRHLFAHLDRFTVIGNVERRKIPTTGHDALPMREVAPRQKTHNHHFGRYFVPLINHRPGGTVRDALDPTYTRSQNAQPDDPMLLVPLEADDEPVRGGDGGFVHANRDRPDARSGRTLDVDDVGRCTRASNRQKQGEDGTQWNLPLKILTSKHRGLSPA